MKSVHDYYDIDPITDCWVWNLKPDSKGYGQKRIGSIKDGTRRMVRAHRWVYEQIIGAIPGDLDLDHLCLNKLCVNPSHLEPVTVQINNLRAHRKLVCKRGHIMIGDNVKMRQNNRRECRTCVNDLWNERYAKLAGSGC